MSFFKELKNYFVPLIILKNGHFLRKNLTEILEVNLVDLELIELGIMVMIRKELQLLDYFKIPIKYSKTIRIKLIKLVLMRNRKLF